MLDSREEQGSQEARYIHSELKITLSTIFPSQDVSFPYGDTI